MKTKRVKLKWFVLMAKKGDFDFEPTKFEPIHTHTNAQKHIQNKSETEFWLMMVEFKSSATNPNRSPWLRILFMWMLLTQKRAFL